MVEDRFDGAWALPSPEACFGVLPEARAALAAVEEWCAEAGAEVKMRCLQRLLIHHKGEEMPDDMLDARHRDYGELLSYPADVWIAGTAEALQTINYFPSIAELTAIMSPRCRRREGIRKRLRTIIERGERFQPRSLPDYSPEGMAYADAMFAKCRDVIAEAALRRITERRGIERDMERDTRADGPADEAPGDEAPRTPQGEQPA